VDNAINKAGKYTVIVYYGGAASKSLQNTPFSASQQFMMISPAALPTQPPSNTQTPEQPTADANTNQNSSPAFDPSIVMNWYVPVGIILIVLIAVATSRRKRSAGNYHPIYTRDERPDYPERYDTDRYVRESGEKFIDEVNDIEDSFTRPARREAKNVRDAFIEGANRDADFANDFFGTGKKRRKR
jgi:hypothetical protein